MLLITLVTGMLRTFAVVLMLPLVFIAGVAVVVATSPVRLFNVKTHEALCDKFLKSAYNFLNTVLGR